MQAVSCPPNWGSSTEPVDVRRGQAPAPSPRLGCFDIGEGLQPVPGCGGRRSAGTSPGTAAGGARSFAVEFGGPNESSTVYRHTYILSE